MLFAIFDSGNYEIYLPDISIGYVSFSDVSSRGRDFTICFWLKTAYSGFFIEYAVAASREQNATLVLGLCFDKRSFDILFGSIRRYNNINNNNNNNNKNKWDFTVTTVIYSSGAKLRCYTFQGELFGSAGFSSGLPADERLHLKARTTVQSPFEVLFRIVIVVCYGDLAVYSLACSD